MHKNILVLNGIIIFYILQRISEVLISKENERWLKENCNAVEVDPKESFRMKIFHSFWFFSLIVEANIRNNFSSDLTSFFIYLILGLCLLTRLYTMRKLGVFWTIKIFSMDTQKIVTDGLYRFLRHPNYLIVMIEFICIPLLFRSYFTMVIFSILNIFVLKKRIELEEGTLMQQSNYQEQFLNIRKIFPFYLFLLFFIFSPAQGAESHYNYLTYKDAQKSDQYIKFESSSTKFGFITTKFDGYIKEYKVQYELDGEELKKLNIIIATKGLDTDVDSRNNKMLNDILEVNKYPEIHAVIPEKVILKSGSQEVRMSFSVKGKTIYRAVKFSVSKKDKTFVVVGMTSISLKELEIPDPSIAIAKVNDNFDLNFAINFQ